jgi:light-harvesting complex I chlorophyll a/b binding protein 1/light-harvesting complex I chlorophyll a/b binding protein 4
METMFEDPTFGCDPLGFEQKRRYADKDTMELKEWTNESLAMLAIGGMIHHNVVTGQLLY